MKIQARPDLVELFLNSQYHSDNNLILQMGIRERTPSRIVRYKMGKKTIQNGSTISEIFELRLDPTLLLTCWVLYANPGLQK